MKAKIPIFEYHDLSKRPNNIRTFHSPYVLLKRKFFEQMRWLYQNGYQTLTIDDLLGSDIPEKAVVLTFDDGHISNYKLAFPILKEFNFVATFFIVPTFVGKPDYLSKDQMMEMREYGMKYGSHSLTHPYILSLSKEEILQEVCKSKEIIQNILNDEINHFSVPYGFYDENLIRSVEEAGYSSLVTEDFGYYKLNRNSFQIVPRFTMKSQTDLIKFANISEKRKIKLINDYFTAVLIHKFKKILGYRRYIRFKSLLIKALNSRIIQDHK